MEPTTRKENDPNKKMEEENARVMNRLMVAAACMKTNSSDQVPKFKMKSSKCVDKQAKWMGMHMCPRWHTKGYCWKEECQFAKTHIPAGKVPSNKKEENLQYMACCRASPSLNESGWGLAVPDHTPSKNNPPSSHKPSLQLHSYRRQPSNQQQSSHQFLQKMHCRIQGSS
jgi:hypothetical protein